MKEIPPEDKGALIYLLYKWKRTRPSRTRFVLGSIQYCLEQLREPDMSALLSHLQCVFAADEMLMVAEPQCSMQKNSKRQSNRLS